MYCFFFFIGQSYFVNDRSQNFLIFQGIYNTLTTFSGLSNTIAESESKGLSNEKINPPFTANKSFSPKNLWMHNSKIRLEFKGSCLKQDKVTFTSNNDLNTDFTLGDSLFRSVKLTENADLDKYKYSGYGIGFDSCSKFSSTDGSVGKNVIIFGGDMSSSVHMNNENIIKDQNKN